MAGINKNFNKRVVLMKLETVEGVSAVPTPALNALRVLNLSPTFMDADQKVRQIDKAYFGADPVAMANFKRGASFEMELHGGANPDGSTPPAWMLPLQSAGFIAPIASPGNVASYQLSEAIPSASLYVYLDDLLMTAVGGRSSVGFRIEDDEIPILTFNYLGTPQTQLAAQVGPAAPVLSNGYTDPVVASTENTTFTWGSYTPGLRRWTMDANVDLQFRSLINPIDRVNYAERSWSGEIVIEVPDLLTKDYFSNIRPGTTSSARVVHGTAPGNIVSIDCPKLQITGNVALSEEQGKVMATFPVTALPVNGNDEVVFTSS